MLEIDTPSTESSSDTKASPDSTVEAQTSPLQNLERVTTRKVTPGDLLDMAVAKYIVAVIMAPMTDESQTKEVAADILSSLNSGKIEAHWILGINGKRVGVIAFCVNGKTG